MKLLKTLMLSLGLIGLLGISAASAEEINDKLYIVNLGSTTGTFSQITRAYEQSLSEYYDEVEFIQAGSCAKAVQIAEKLDEPTMILHFSLFQAMIEKGEMDCNIKGAFIRADLVYNHVVVSKDSNLTLEDFKNAENARVGFATPKEFYNKILGYLEDGLGSSYKGLEYESTTITVQALVSGEVDYAIVTSKKAAENKDRVKSILTMNPRGNGDIPAMVTLFDNAPIFLTVGEANIVLLLNADIEDMVYFHSAMYITDRDKDSAAYRWYDGSGYLNTTKLGLTVSESIREVRNMIELSK